MSHPGRPGRTAVLLRRLVRSEYARAAAAVTLVLTVVGGAGWLLLREPSAVPGTRSAAPAPSVSPAIGTPGTATEPGPVPSASGPSAGASPSAPTGPRTVGGGWRQVFPGSFIQLETHQKYTEYPPGQTHAAEAGVSYDRAGGVETFKLFNNDASNRGEVRLKNDYTTGWHQFTGDVRVSSPTDNECVMQVFAANASRPAIMIRADSAAGGTLTLIRSRQTLATHIYGVWVHLNIVDDAGAHTISVYVNGKLTATSQVDPGRHYMKYGVYGTLRTVTAQAEWRNVATFVR